MASLRAASHRRPGARLARSRPASIKKSARHCVRVASCDGYARWLRIPAMAWRSAGAWPSSISSGSAAPLTLIAPQRPRHADGQRAARSATYPVVASSRSACRNMTRASSTCRLPRPRNISLVERRRAAIEVTVDDPDAIDASSRRSPPMRRAWRFTSMTWKQRNQAFFSALAVERNVMFLILTLIILVAALNIISGLIMLVKDKAHDIAILRTMGATRGAVQRVFFMTGAIDRRRGHARRLPARRAICAQCRKHPAVRRLATGTESFPPSSIISRSCPPRSTRRRPPGRGAWRWCSRSRRRSIRPGAPRGSIPWRRCATNDEAPLRARRSSCAMSTAAIRQGPRAARCLPAMRTLTVEPGEIVALVGPSGAGKSSLLHIAGLLEAPTAGEVFIAGQNCTALDDAARTRVRRVGIGFVYQFHHLLPEFSALENVVMPQMIAGAGKRAGAGARAASCSRVWASASALDHRPGRAVGRRAAARRHRPRPRQPAAVAAGRRADRQSRPARPPNRCMRNFCALSPRRGWARWSRPTTSNSPGG